MVLSGKLAKAIASSLSSESDGSFSSIGNMVRCGTRSGELSCTVKLINGWVTDIGTRVSNKDQIEAALKAADPG